MTASAPDVTAAVSVVIPLYNGRDLIEDCIRSVPPNVEIVVTDDGSTDGAPELVEARFPDVIVIRGERNVGFGSNANRGLERATRDVRVVLNSDARLRPGALEALAATFADDERVGIAGPRLVFPDGSHQTSAASFPSVANSITGSFLANELFRRIFPERRFPFELGLAERDHASTRDVDWVMGVCLAIHRRCLDDVGGFDPAYFMYVEETDLCLRAHRAGWQVRYVADAVVEHLGGGSTGDPAVHARRFLDSERLFMTRCYGPAVEPRWRAARIAGSAAKAVALAAPAMVSGRARARWRWHREAVHHLRTAHATPNEPV